MKKYLVIHLSQIKNSRIKYQNIIKLHNITDILIVELREIIYRNLSEEIAQFADQIGVPVTVLQFNSSHVHDKYTTIGLEWCAHSGFVWENRISSNFISTGKIDRHHNDTYRFKSGKLMTFLGKVRFKNRILFWDNLIMSGQLNDLCYSYYDLLPGTQAHDQRTEDISELKYFIRSDPNTWRDLERTTDFDLSNRVPGCQPDVGNLFYSGYPTNPDLYDQTIGSLVPETTCTHKHMVPFITEKTYRAIQNYHPFWIFGDPGSQKYLRSQGYETFESEFGTDIDPGDLMIDILENHDISNSLKFSLRDRLCDHIEHVIKHFSECQADNYLTIKAKVEHNRHCWLKNVVSDQDQLTQHFKDSEFLDIQTNQPITNIIDFLYQYHHIYLMS